MAVEEAFVYKILKVFELNLTLLGPKVPVISTHFPVMVKVSKTIFGSSESYHVKISVLCCLSDNRKRPKLHLMRLGL